MNLTHKERVGGLTGFGYTEREAEFLLMAALHGGFFQRRQYLQSIGNSAGGADAALIEKLIGKGHGTALMGCQKAVVYHIAARPFYNAIGQENNRNRRRRPAISIMSRLMGLDFVLDHPGQYLDTEEDKIAYFTSTLGIGITDLPTKAFRSPNSQVSASRFFVDKYPIRINEDTASKQVVGFCYIDEGAATLSHFEAYVAQYRRLLTQLHAFELTYVSASRRLFWEAERHFNGLVSGRTASDGGYLNSLDMGRLLRYFQDRQRYESGPDSSFDRAKLIRFRDDRLEFAGPFFESLYPLWTRAGDKAVRMELDTQKSSTQTLNGTFHTCLLRRNYDLFGTISNAKEA